MAIEIIDGFKVNSAVPVDNRIVASGSTARNAINYKYEGLRVFDTSDSIPYVWLNNTWEKENNTSLSIPSGVTLGFTNTTSYRSGQILKVYNSNKLLTNSNMFEVEFLDTLGSITSKSIAINHSTAASVSSTSKLDVNGSIKATSFEGSGANITNIDPVNFNTTTNKIKNTQIDHGANGYILQTVDDGLGNLSVQWKNPTSIISPNSVSTQIEATQTSVHYLTFVPATSGGNLLVFQNSTTQVIGVIPFTGQVVVKGDNSPSTPPFSFLGETNSGFYRSGVGTVAISILGNKKIELDTNGLKVIPGNATNPGLSFIGGGNYGMYQTTSGSNRIGIVVAGNEMIRIKSSSTQGNGNTSIYGDGNVLSLIGNTHVYLEFYRQGSATPNTSSTRGAWIGYSSGSSSDFSIVNTITNTNLNLQNDGRVLITSRTNTSYGVEIGNKGTGTVTNAYGVYVYGTFNNTQLQSSHNGVIARFDAGNGTTNYTSIYVTTQGLLVWGSPTGTGTQPTYSGSATNPSIAFNGNGGTGFYSNAADTLGVSTGGVSRMVINNSGIKMFKPTISTISSSTQYGTGAMGMNTTTTSTNYIRVSGSYGLNSTPFDNPSAAYDRIIYVTSSAYSGQDTHYWEARVNFSGTYISVYQQLMNTWARFNFIVPAGCTYTITAQRSSGGAIANVTILESRLGLG